MTDSFNEYFEENTQWVSGNSAAPAAQPPEPPKSRREMRKRRKLRKHKHWIIAIVVIAVVSLVATGAYFGYRRIAAVRAVNEYNANVSQDYEGSGEGSVLFTVQQGEDAQTVGENLVNAEVVKSASSFANAVSANSATLYPGTFELKKHMSNLSALKILCNASNAVGFLDVRSGDRISDVIVEAAQLSDIDESEFQSIIDGGGKGILPDEAGGKFEGWLEPGQYDVKSKTSASDILKMMVDKRIQKLDEMGVPTGSERERLLNIASIAEAEVNSEEYYGKVTRVILNRLDQNMTLGMDSTVAYGNNVKPAKITQAMIDDESNPYNTRINKGLPPTPISNPGDNAIKAAMNPESGDWLYFVTTNLKTGETKFTASSEEFEKYVQEYKTTNENAN